MEQHIVNHSKSGKRATLPTPLVSLKECHWSNYVLLSKYFCIVCLFRWTARRNRLINTSQIAIPLNWDFAYVRKQIYLCTNCPDLDEMNMCLVKNFIPLHIQCGKKESATNSKFQQIKMISYCVVCDNFQYKAFKQVLLKKFVKTH